MKQWCAVTMFYLLSQFCFAQNWQSLGSGLSSWTTYLYADSLEDRLFMSGLFWTADTQTVRGVTAYDGTTFNQMGTGMNACQWGWGQGNPWEIIRYGSWVYFGGNFDCMGGLNNARLARWSGAVWDTIPGGGLNPAGVVRGMTVYNNELYICGTFTSVGGVMANQIAKFDDTAWSVVADNYNSELSVNWFCINLPETNQPLSCKISFPLI